MAGGKWNRSARRSGGHRPVPIVVPPLGKADAELLMMIEKVRRDFGEAGVKRLMELIEQRSQYDGTNEADDVGRDGGGKAAPSR